MGVVEMEDNQVRSGIGHICLSHSESEWRFFFLEKMSNYDKTTYISHP